MIYNGKDLYFPTKLNHVNEGEKLPQKTLYYFEKKIEVANVNFEPNDVIIIGSGINPQISRLATLNAALTLF